jgi:hypothetical protein
MDTYIYANAASEENGGRGVSTSSTGFQPTTTNVGINASGDTYTYIAFADTREALLWADKSGKGNDWTANNIDASDEMLDSPTNNFATWNPLTSNGTVSNLEGNLQRTGSSQHSSVIGSIGHTTGKWYFEVMRETHMDWDAGITSNSHCADTTEHDNTGAWGFYAYTPKHRENGGAGTSYGSALSTNGDILMIAYDLDAGKIWYGKNGTWFNSSNPSTATSPASTSLVSGDTYTPFVHTGNDGSVSTIVNFGQDSSFAGNVTAGTETDDNGYGSFKYDVPDGFLALCTNNLTAPAVKPQENFGVVTYAGDGNSEVLDIGFQTDLIWNRRRNDATNFYLQDVVRGFGASKSLSCNTTSVEAYDGNPASQSVTVGSTTTTVDGSDFIYTGYNYVSWNWKAGGAGVSNTNGSIASTVSANVESGFSVVSFLGTGVNATVGHGLSSIPQMVFIKSRDSTYNWRSYNETVGNTAAIHLNLSDGPDTDSAYFQNTTPTNQVFSIGTNLHVNKSSDNFIAYCFHSVEGYSKVGSYTGNGSADGTFVYCGFQPKYVLWKRSNTTGSWGVSDSARSPYNDVDDVLYPDTSGSEYSDTSWSDIDFVSNGIKIRTNDSFLNASGSTYIFIAFAEHPFKYTTAR